MSRKTRKKSILGVQAGYIADRFSREGSGPIYAGGYFGDLSIPHELVGQAIIGWS